jgi:hypothetical protein
LGGVATADAGRWHHTHLVPTLGVRGQQLGTHPPQQAHPARHGEPPHQLQLLLHEPRLGRAALRLRHGPLAAARTAVALLSHRARRHRTGADAVHRRRRRRRRSPLRRRRGQQPSRASRRRRTRCRLARAPPLPRSRPCAGWPRPLCSTPPAARAGARSSRPRRPHAHGASPPPIDAPCTQCLRHGDPMHAQERLTASASRRA